MASRIQSVDMAVFDPVMNVGPQTYVRSGPTEVNALTAGLDTDGFTGASTASTCDLAGYRGAIVTVYFTPIDNAASSTATLVTLKHGESSSYATHTAVSSDPTWGFIEPGEAAGGAEKTLTFLVDSSRVNRYISVNITLNANLLCFLAVSITPVGPLTAKSSNVNRTDDLFITSSGTQSFPDLS